MMAAAIWAGAGTASDVLLLAAVIVAGLDVLAKLTGRSELAGALLTAAVLLVALGLLAL